MENKIKTKIYTYKYNVGNEEERKFYLRELREAQNRTGLKKPDTFHWVNFDRNENAYSQLKNFHAKLQTLQHITIDTTYLFSNQFNTKEGLRVFIWSEIEYKNKDIKEGYYIEMTEELKEAYKKAQIYGSSKRGKERTEKEYKKIEEDYKKETEKATVEYKGKKWLLDNKIDFSLYENCIYYSHSKEWFLGWRNKLTFEQEQYLKVTLKGFPYKYKLKV